MTYILKSPRKQMGYMIVDHSASPGLTEAQARFAGYGPEAAGECKVYETHTLTCSHCQGVVVPNPLRVRERHSCAKCGHHYICDGCAFEASLPDYVHTPARKKIYG